MLYHCSSKVSIILLLFGRCSARSKRLGNSRSTMFVIGGTTALKNHKFFADGALPGVVGSLDWQALEALEIEPPIRPFADNSRAGNRHGSDADEENDGSIETAFFDADFTTQPISPSGRFLI